MTLVWAMISEQENKSTGNKRKEMREEKWDCIKIKSPLAAKEVRVKRKPAEWEKIFTNSSPNKILILEYIRNSKRKLN